MAAHRRAVHFGFDTDGPEVRVSDRHRNVAVIVPDRATLTEVRRFTGLPTPTGRFNVYNTAHDIYRASELPGRL